MQGDQHDKAPGWTAEVMHRLSINSRMTSLAMNSGYRFESTQSSGMRHLTFTDQVDTVKEDLVSHFWTEDSRVVANSFGAYLFLHAQASLEPYPGRVLLLSPIVGGFADENTGYICVYQPFIISNTSISGSSLMRLWTSPVLMTVTVIL